MFLVRNIYLPLTMRFTKISAIPKQYEACKYLSITRVFSRVIFNLPINPRIFVFIN